MASNISLEDLLQCVTFEKLTQPCKDAHLSRIALSVTQWCTIAPFLKLTSTDERAIEERYRGELISQNIAMLRKWRESRGRRATYMRLAKVFYDLGKLSLVEKVRDVLRNECSSSESEGESEQGCVEGSGRHSWSLPRYASYLKSVYRTTRPPVQSHQLLPPPTHTVFNLALIQKEQLEFGPNEELVRLLQRGQVKEAAESHIEIELSNLMRADDEVRKVILIEGAPGSGKSTLAWHICQQWEKGELFSEYEVVVFVQLRDLGLQSATSVAGILPVECTDQAPDIAALLSRSGRWGRGVLLVLDGWDELQPECPLHSLLTEVISVPKKANMHCSSVIVTTRPVSSGDLQRHASSRVEVLGFKPEEVQEYFKACFGRNRQLYARFVDQLRERPVIEASCFLPINAVIIVYMFRYSNCSLPHTLHGVFEELVLSCIVRHCTERLNTRSDITALHLGDLPPDIAAPLSALSSLAYHGIETNKVVFSETDLKDFKLPVDLSTTLSLVQVVEGFGNRRYSKSYNFFHLQIQELLAAYHISKLEGDEQIRIFKDLFGQPRFAAVFQFYAAFTRLQAPSIREVLVNMLKDKKYYSSVLYCVYEAQDPSLCQFVGYTLHTCMTGKGELRPLFYLRSWSNPLYVIALGYFLCYYCYYCSEELLVSVDSTNMKPLVKEFLKHQSHITATPLQYHNCGSLAFDRNISVDNYWESCVQCASELLSSLQPFITGLVFSVRNSAIFQKLSTNFSMLVKHPSFLQHLGLVILFVSNVSSIAEPDILTSLHSINSLKQLHSFKVQNVQLKMPQSVFKAVCSSMASNSSVRYLKLHKCRIELKDPASPLLHAIPLGNTLKVIDLTGTSLGGCVSPLLMGLASNTSVVELILEGCRVDLTGKNGQALCETLRTNTTLRALNLLGGFRRVDGKMVHTLAVDLHAVCVGLTLNTSLAYLDLRGCQLTVIGKSGPVLAHMLQTNTTLKSLKLDGNDRISNEGVVYLAQGLAQNRGLETLSIADCGISTAVVELAEALKTNKCLLSLDISGNDIGERFVHIVRSLQVNSTLRDLRASMEHSVLTGHARDEWKIRHSAVMDIVGSSLESLDLSGNTIGDKGAAHIAQWVTNSCTLYQLNLEGCDIGDRGIECLASALEGNTSLEILHIPGNEFTDTGLLALGRSLKKNKSLKTLNTTSFNTSLKCVTTVEGEKQFVLSLCDNGYLSYLSVAHTAETRDEVSKVNQIRRDKNRNTLSTYQ